MTPESKITITRGNAYTDRARAYKVFVDGSEIGRVKNEQSETFPIAPGTHEVYLKLDWTKSPKVSFDVGAGEEVRFVCRPAANAANAMVKSLLKPSSYLNLEREDSL